MITCRTKVVEVLTTFHVTSKKGLALLIRVLEGLEVKIEYILSHKHFDMNHRTTNVDHNNVYLHISNFRSYVMSQGILGSKMGLSLISYILKITNILKSVIEQKLLDIKIKGLAP